MAALSTNGPTNAADLGVAGRTLFSSIAFAEAMTPKITLIKAGDRRPAPSQTPGMIREEACSGDGVWAGFVRAAPQTPSGWHHHGENESIIYVLEGRLRIEFGPGGREAVEAGPGDFVRVPRHAIHRENNPSASEGKFIVVRFGSGPPNTNMAGPAPS